jgi:hypothetical protein
LFHHFAVVCPVVQNKAICPQNLPILPCLGVLGFTTICLLMVAMWLPPDRLKTIERKAILVIDADGCDFTITARRRGKKRGER